MILFRFSFDLEFRESDFNLLIDLRAKRGKFLQLEIAKKYFGS